MRIGHITNSSAMVSWTPPPQAFNNGPLTGYRVLVKSVFEIEGSLVNWTNQTSGDTAYIEIERLFPFQRYMVAIAAVNEAGIGPWSDGRHFATSSASMVLY